jgi:hypothetical protein
MYMYAIHPVVVPPLMNPASIPRRGMDQMMRIHTEGSWVTPILPSINIRDTHTTDHERMARLYPTP